MNIYASISIVLLWLALILLFLGSLRKKAKSGRRLKAASIAAFAVSFAALVVWAAIRWIEFQ